MSCGCWDGGLSLLQGKHSGSSSSTRKNTNLPKQPAHRSDDLSPEQQEKLSAMRTEIGHSALPDHLLRFLRARKWDLKAALEQYLATQRWRKENDIDRFRRNCAGPTGGQKMVEARRHCGLSSDGVELFPQLRLVDSRPHEGAWLWHGQTLAFGFDKQGRPIHLQQCGRSSCRFAALWKWIGDQTGDARKAIIDGYLAMQELQAARMEESSERLGRPVTQQVVIMDLEGLSYWPDPRAVSVFRYFVDVTQSYYPETLAMHFFLNTPAFFVGIWNMIKGICDPVTASKMHLLGRDFKSTLLEFIDADQLPIDYGGTNNLDLLRKLYSIEECEAIVHNVRKVAEALPDRRSSAEKQPGMPVPKEGSKELRRSDSSVPLFLYASLLTGLLVLMQLLLFKWHALLVACVRCLHAHGKE
eukprot:TRINITY_DN32983_c0_g1_i1.p1 TRINITY_DN32983_c0_g1~~TRINITY_DN32983_c0_g1_i1.p1  ORF type:complete len:414 (+),score=57.99 TRINITY_DN32983_c0_g1_i1:23-1264(+)